MLNLLSGSFQITPMFFVNWDNGVAYNLVAQTPQYRIQSIRDIQNIPIAGSSKGNPEILADVASMKRGSEVAVISHYNISRRGERRRTAHRRRPPQVVAAWNVHHHAGPGGDNA